MRTAGTTSVRVCFCPAGWSRPASDSRRFHWAAGDNHGNIFHALGDGHLPMFDQSFAAFISDMSQRGLLERTLVVVMGEFGRDPVINRDGGRGPLLPRLLAASGGRRH